MAYQTPIEIYRKWSEFAGSLCVSFDVGALRGFRLVIFSHDKPEIELKNLKIKRLDSRQIEHFKSTYTDKSKIRIRQLDA